MLVNVGKRERAASVLGGAFFVILGLRSSGSRRVALGATGGALILRGLSGYCPVSKAIGRNAASAEAPSVVEISEALTILKPRHDVYKAWRQLENLPKFMTHLREVRHLGGDRSHWIARLPRDAGSIEWDARLIADKENEQLAWQSDPGAVVDNAGEITFKDASGGRGTEVMATIHYRPVASSIGRMASRALNPVFARMVREDLRRFKQILEAGEVPVSDAMPSEDISAHH